MTNRSIVAGARLWATTLCPVAVACGDDPGMQVVVLDQVGVAIPNAAVERTVTWDFTYEWDTACVLSDANGLAEFDHPNYGLQGFWVELVVAAEGWQTEYFELEKNAAPKRVETPLSCPSADVHCVPPAAAVMGVDGCSRPRE